ncbi:hypothetical protein GCM10023080_039760 [Streptomyces pseudoechinosporeus]
MADLLLVPGRSWPGAELTSAVAEVTGGELDLFDLSHTCPASASVPTEPGYPQDLAILWITRSEALVLL